MPPITSFSWYLYLFCSVSAGSPTLGSRLRRQEVLSPVLTTIQHTPELSIFYSLFNSTGGDSGIPGPALEERFNDPNDNLTFTIFAPTNDAFANVSSAALAALTAPTSYQLLYSLLINHIAPGALAVSDLQKSIHAVGGFEINFDPADNIRTNANIDSSNTEQMAEQASLVRNQDGQPVQMPASNGVVYQIDHVLDGFFTYFGIDPPSADGTGLPAITNQAGTTMRDILENSAELSQLNTIWQTLNPDFVHRLSLYSQDAGVNDTTVYLAPSNTAFANFPEVALHKALQASNVDLTQFLLGLGLGAWKEGDSRVETSTSKLQVMVQGDRVNNARVEQRICAENGCVWMIGKWIDPLFGIF